MRRRLFPPVALLALAALVLASCGGGGDDTAATTTTSTTRATTTTTTTTTMPPGPVSVLTGAEVDDESVLARPVVAVKFDNVHGRSTPQVGINAADVVYEITVEGGVTRFLALFQSEDAAPLGPVRSARGSEVGLLEELHQPLFVWHGANGILRAAVRSSDIIARSIDDIPQLFYRERSRPAPYNSFVQGTAEVRATAPEDATGPTESIFSFVEEPGQPPSPNAVAATSVSILFPAFRSSRSSAAPVRFDWDPDTEQWLRFQGDGPHVDGDGEQIAVDNVIVRFTEAVDSGTVDKAGSRVPTAKVTGEGEAWVLSQGTITTGIWSKPDNVTPARYFDQTGGEILLTPGTTWVAMPYGGGSSYELAS